MTEIDNIKRLLTHEGEPNGFLVLYEDGSQTHMPSNTDDAADLEARLAANEPGLVVLAADSTRTWPDRRQSPLDLGGYGTQIEQLEILGEQGIDAFQQHIAAVKAAHPKE